MTMLQKVFNVLAITLSVLQNYFDRPNKIFFSDLYLAKFLDTSANSEQIRVTSVIQFNFHTSDIT